MASSAAPGPPTHGSWGCVLCISSPQHNRVTLKEDCLLPHVLFCLLRRERWELLFARCWMALGSPRAFHLLPCWGHPLCRTGRGPQGLPPRSRNPPEGSQRTDVKRVSPANKWESSLATPTAQGRALAGGSALDPTHTSWISEGRASQGAHAPRTGSRVLTQEAASVAPSVCGTASPARLEVLL